MEPTVRFNDLPRHEQLDIFLPLLNVHPNEEEILDLLAAFVAYTAPTELVKQYMLWDVSTEEARDRVNSWLNSDDAKLCEQGWDAVLDTLSAERVLDIIENPYVYLGNMRKINTVIRDLRAKLYREFVLGDRP